MAKCKGCGRKIIWRETPAGKSMPVDPEPVLYWPRTRGSGKVVNLKGAVVSCTFDGPMTEPGEYGYVPHWATCPYNGNGCHEKLCTDAADAIEALQAQLPKRGKWIYKPKDAIEMMFTLPKCSVCGHESSDANNYCPNCGAKMEVQDDKA